MKSLRGSTWTEQELEFIVEDYFDMLSKEISRTHYVKAESRRLLVQKTGRSEASIEMKRQNISAVLQLLGLPIVSGYKPLRNFQASLISTIENYLSKHSPETIVPTSSQSFFEPSQLFIYPAPVMSPPLEEDEINNESIRRIVRKFDPVERDARNRSLGASGEQLVFQHERSSLESVGRSDLAHKVRWISRDEGDGAGYDIHSFNQDGSDRLLEVKTTHGHERTPFYISRNELSLSHERPNDFRIIRVYNFALAPQAFEIAPPIEALCRLEATSYSASLR